MPDVIAHRPRQVRLVGEAEVLREIGERRLAVGEPVHGAPDADPIAVPRQRNSGLAREHAAEPERRDAQKTRQPTQRRSLGDIGQDRLPRGRRKYAVPDHGFRCVTGSHCDEL